MIKGLNELCVGILHAYFMLSKNYCSWLLYGDLGLLFSHAWMFFFLNLSFYLGSNCCEIQLNVLHERLFCVQSQWVMRTQGEFCLSRKFLAWQCHCAVIFLADYRVTWVFFILDDDLGGFGSAHRCLMKQKHRMIAERKAQADAEKKWAASLVGNQGTTWCNCGRWGWSATAGKWINI